MSEDNTRSDWGQQALRRIKLLWWLKMAGTTICISAFMVVYLTLQRHTQFPITWIPPTAMDRLIDFHAWSLWPYVSLWLYIGLVPMLLLRWREFKLYMSTVALLAVTGLLIFLFWPTAITPPGIDWSPYPWIDALKTVDASGTACPSMHVGFSVLTAAWLRRQLQHMGAPLLLQLLNVAWCLLILWSTMALKQHLFLDVIAGTTLALIIVLPHLALEKAHPVWSGRMVR